MKLRFTIHYATQWGESLHVVVCYTSTDGMRKTSNLTMLTTDGTLWAVETAAVESRQHPIASITYYYQVSDADERLLRREWTLVPRTFYFDTSKNYIFADQWHDRPLNYHLYTSAYLTTCHAPHGEQVEPRRMPLYRKTLVFRVAAPQLATGQSVALVGSHPALGQWSPARYLRMEYIGQGEWLLSVNADAISMPLAYKYVVVDDQTHALTTWEDGDNRLVDQELTDGQVLVLHGEPLRTCEKTWRLAGVVVPVFSLRSTHSCGVGDFGDLRLMVDWAAATGMRVIQLLPVNDTTTDGKWHDSHPYNIVSCFALHPHYLDLNQLGELSDQRYMTAFRRQQRELNALPQSNYEAVHRVKMEYAAAVFAERGEATLKSDAFRRWFAANRDWLEPYAQWSQYSQLPQLSRNNQQPQLSFTYFLQYHLHLQLKTAADYAREKGIVLKGDVPIGISRHSVETATRPQLFNLDSCAGAMPDNTSPMGQNWGFPTYNWDGELAGVAKWFAHRFSWMEQYFEAVRLDHVLAFFRSWEIPETAVYGLLGHFSPALPLTVGEIEYFGLPFRKELYTQPFVNDRVLERLFGIHAQFVRDHFLMPKSYGLYAVKAEYSTQRQIQQHFDGMSDENSHWIREGMYRLLSNVLFLEDQRQPDMYHPRFMAWHEPVFDALGAEEKDAYMRLYNNYFYQRHSMFWGSGAIRRLADVLGDTRLLVCAEDLGQLPDCVAPVLDALRILSLEIQSLPKQCGYEFAHLDANPCRSVATLETHDMSPLRLWWEESPERTQRYYVTMLQKEGRAPDHLPAHLAEEIIARHLYCPSMLCLLSLQDWLAIDGELRSKHPRQERINVPSDPYNRWQWRMHITIEELLKADRYNQKLRTMITRSKR